MRLKTRRWTEWWMNHKKDGSKLLLNVMPQWIPRRAPMSNALPQGPVCRTSHADIFDQILLCQVSKSVLSTTPLLALQPSPRLLFPFLQHPMEHRAQPQNPAAVSNPITSNNPSTSMRFTHQSHHQPLERVKAASVRVIVGMGTRFIRFDHLPYPHPHLRVIAGHPRHRWPRPLSKVLAGRYPRSR